MPSRSLLLALTVIAAPLPVLTGCQSTPQAPARSGEPTLETLASLMQGSFSSEAQSKRTPMTEDQEGYFDIRVELAPIWEDRVDGVWLYVEQAISSSIEKPYRQRVYRLASVGNNDFVSEVYTLPGDAPVFAGAHKNPELLDSISPSDLEQLEGCTVFLSWTGPDEFAGGTVGFGCENSWGGAAYAQSTVTITADGFTAWDKGFDANGNQVWGPTLGPYRFDRVR